MAQIVLLRLMGRRQAGMTGLLKSGFRLRRHSGLPAAGRRRPESTPAWMQGVERRREQAAEVVEPRQEQAAEEGGLGRFGRLHWLLLQGYIISGHARLAGMACINHWIPACAGMTAEVSFPPPLSVIDTPTGMPGVR